MSNPTADRRGEGFAFLRWCCGTWPEYTHAPDWLVRQGLLKLWKDGDRYR